MLLQAKSSRKAELDCPTHGGSAFRAQGVGCGENFTQVGLNVSGLCHLTYWLIAEGGKANGRVYRDAYGLGFRVLVVLGPSSKRKLHANPTVKSSQPTIDCILPIYCTAYHTGEI